MQVPLSKPEIDEHEIEAVTNVLKSGWLAHGPKNKEFEANFAEYIGVKHAIAFNSCTSALQIALEAYSLKGEVIVPSFTFVASANSIVLAGCKPLFADISYDTCNIDPEDIRKKITKKTVAIMPVHYAGQPCNMKEIMEIAEEFNLKLIEDSAETLGGEFNGQKTGTFGVGCFSFFPTKNITTGEGGMLTTNDDGILERVNELKAHGISSSTFQREKVNKPWLRDAVVPGYNFRLCDILAAIGVEQMKKVDKLNNLRRKHASYLNKELNIDGIDIPIEKPNTKHVYQMYTIKLAQDINRSSFLKVLREKGVGASVHFDPPVHLQSYYQKMYKGLNLPVTEDVANRIVTLPMYPSMTKRELSYIVDSVKSALRSRK